MDRGLPALPIRLRSDINDPLSLIAAFLQGLCLQDALNAHARQGTEVLNDLVPCRYISRARKSSGRRLLESEWYTRHTYSGPSCPQCPCLAEKRGNGWPCAQQADNKNLSQGVSAPQPLGCIRLHAVMPTAQCESSQALLPEQEAGRGAHQALPGSLCHPRTQDVCRELVVCWGDRGRKDLTPFPKVHRTPPQEQHHPVKEAECCKGHRNISFLLVGLLLGSVAGPFLVKTSKYSNQIASNRRCCCHTIWRG